MLSPKERRLAAHHATLLLIDAEWAQLQFEHLGLRGWWKRRTTKQVWVALVSVFVLFGCVLYDQAANSQGHYDEPFYSKNSEIGAEPSPSGSRNQIWFPQTDGGWSTIPVEGGPKVRRDTNAAAKPEVHRAGGA